MIEVARSMHFVAPCTCMAERLFANKNAGPRVAAPADRPRPGEDVLREAGDVRTYTMRQSPMCPAVWTRLWTRLSVGVDGIVCTR